MLAMQQIQSIYLIGNRQAEPERYKEVDKLLKALRKSSTLNLDKCEIIEWCPTYGRNISPSLKKKWLSPNANMKPSHASLTINYAEALDNIANTKTDNGYFLILESDVLWDSEKFPSRLKETLDGAPIGWHAISIGHGCDLIPPDAHSSSEIRLYKMGITRCTDSILWSYEGATKKVEAFKRYPAEIALDHYMNEILRLNPSISFYWAHPWLITQGSLTGTYKSKISPVSPIMAARKIVKKILGMN